MCKGQDPPDFSAPSPSLRRRAAAMEAELSLARVRLLASVEALRREVEHLRRMEESLSECKRLRNMLAAMDVVRAHLADSRMSEIIELVRNRVLREIQVHWTGR